MMSEAYWHSLISCMAFFAMLLDENVPMFLYLGPGLWSMITQSPPPTFKATSAASAGLAKTTIRPAATRYFS
jgi:hypothetical protein